MPNEIVIPVGHIPAEPGIYKMTHAKSGDVYVGQSENMLARIRQHVSGLQGGHPQRRIAKCCDKHGAEHFTFEVLEQCDIDSLNDREMHWIEELKPTLNSSQGGGTKRRTTDDVSYTIALTWDLNYMIEKLATAGYRTPEQQILYMLKTLADAADREALLIEKMAFENAKR